MTEHFIPFRKRDLLARLHATDAPGSAAVTVSNLIEHVLRTEFAQRLDQLKDLYDGMDPNRDTLPLPGTTAEADHAGFSAALRGLLERANYRPLTKAELDEALNSESVFKVKLHTELSDFRELTIYARGKRQRQETLTSWFGFKKRTIDVDYFERVLIDIRFQDEAHFTAQKRKNLPFKPGTSQLKLFANVPVADLEMLFPNSEVRMKSVDKVMIGVPAAIGVVTMSAKIGTVLLFLWGGLRWVGAKTGVHQEHVDVGVLAAQASLVIGACVAIYLFINRQLMNYRFRKIKFMKALADSLYFRNLDNNAGAFHRVGDEALEEDIKEAALAYRFLSDQPRTAAELDAEIEAWFTRELGTTLDFEVEDGLAKLERLGLAQCREKVWTSLAPAAAVVQLGNLSRGLVPS